MNNLSPQQTAPSYLTSIPKSSDIFANTNKEDGYPAKNGFPFFVEFRALTKLLSDLVQQKEKPRFSSVDLGNIFLDVVGRKIHKHEKSTKLTEKETKILWYLLSNPNLKIDKKLLLKEIWGYKEEIETRTLTTHIYRIRQKLLEIGEDGYEISNIENSYILKTG